LTQKAGQKNKKPTHALYTLTQVLHCEKCQALTQTACQRLYHVNASGARSFILSSTCTHLLQLQLLRCRTFLASLLPRS